MWRGLKYETCIVGSAEVTVQIVLRNGPCQGNDDGRDVSQVAPKGELTEVAQKPTLRLFMAARGLWKVPEEYETYMASEQNFSNLPRRPSSARSTCVNPGEHKPGKCLGRGSFARDKSD